MLSAEQFRAEFDQLMLLVPIAAMVDVKGLREVIERAHAVAPILDPTAYQRGMGNLEEQSRVLSAFAPFAKLARELMAHVPGSGEG